MKQAFIIAVIFAQLACCRQKEDTEPISLIYENGKAIGVSISKSLLSDFDEDSVSRHLKIHLAEADERVSVLGDFTFEDNLIIFTPVVHFTSGLEYEVVYRDSLIDKFIIPEADTETPELLNVYPTQDTVPENLLKMYFYFSQPMAEGRSLSFINVMNNNDTLKGTFLDLQPELWNEDGTLLTLWLDPGRIKRDLIPNKELGNPLKAGEEYTLLISANWKSKSGKELAHGFTKTFFVASRDEQKPDPQKWVITTPKASTHELLKINFTEPLDYALIHNAIWVADEKGNSVQGTIQSVDEERTLTFQPTEPWKDGRYFLQIEARLEDLAGNNLNRLFDREVGSDEAEGKEMFVREFVVK